MEMTKELLRKICKEDKLYMTPSLNDKLYLNFKGFTSISNLDAYTGLKALFLEGNALDTITLPLLEQLKCLYLQQNMIWEISGLENAPALNTLNLCSNNISKVQNLSHLAELSTLQLAHNRLSDVASLEHLEQCPSITSLDLSHNRIEDAAVLDVFKNMPNLACLYLQGNPVVSSIRNYRKTLIAAIPSLTYLDDRPVFELERACAEAFMKGGVEAERAARERLREEEREREKRNFEHMRKIREDAFRRRREAMGLAPGDTDPDLDEFSDGEWEFGGEPEELVRARERLAQFSARPQEEEPSELAEARRRMASSGKQIKEAAWQAIGGPEEEAPASPSEPSPKSDQGSDVQVLGSGLATPTHTSELQSIALSGLLSPQAAEAEAPAPPRPAARALPPVAAPQPQPAAPAAPLPLLKTPSFKAAAPSPLKAPTSQPLGPASPSPIHMGGGAASDAPASPGLIQLSDTSAALSPGGSSMFPPIKKTPSMKKEKEKEVPRREPVFEAGPPLSLDELD